MTNIHAASTPSVANQSHSAGVIKQTNPAKQIDPAKITRRYGWNPRFDFGEIEVLATSLRANGMLNAIRVKRLGVPTDSGHIFELIDGDRRLAAVELILKKNADAFPDGIPAILVDRSQDDVTSLIQMFESNTGKAFLPIEEAHAFSRMRDSGMTIRQIELKTGRSDNAIVGALALLEADSTLVDAVANGSIKKGLGKSIAVNARGDLARQKELTAAALAAGTDKKKQQAVKTAVDDSRRAKAEKRGLKLKIRALSDSDLSALGNDLAETLARSLQGLGLNLDTDLKGWVQGDESGELEAAYLFGALEGLKAAAGIKVKFTG